MWRIYEQWRLAIFTRLVASLIVAIASTLAVMSGFGFVLFSAPLLSLLYDPSFVVLITIAMSTLLLGVLFVTTDIRDIMDWRLALLLTLSSVVGMPFGVMLLPWMDRTVFRLVVGGITILFVLSRVLGRKLTLPSSQMSVVISGILGGVFSTSTGLSALPIVWFLGTQNQSPTVYRATIAAYVFMNGVLSLVILAVSGSLRALDPLQVLSFSPALLIGLAVGILLVKKLSDTQLERGSLVYLGIIGLLTAASIRV